MIELHGRDPFPILRWSLAVVGEDWCLALDTREPPPWRYDSAFEAVIAEVRITDPAGAVVLDGVGELGYDDGPYIDFVSIEISGRGGALRDSRPGDRCEVRFTS